MDFVNEVQELIGNSLSKAIKLQAVHINSMTPRVEGSDLSYVSARDALRIVNQCSPAITQIGCASRVWQVSWASNIHSHESYTELGCKGGYTSGKR